MAHLFVYGTLMCPEIMQAVSGMSVQGEPAQLQGYGRRAVRSQHFPALFESASERVQGCLYRHISRSAWARLDRFEGSMYRRCLLELELPGAVSLGAYVYVVEPEYLHLLAEHDWDYAEFLSHGRRLFESGYAGYDAL